jgi:hypothetical protein
MSLISDIFKHFESGVESFFLDPRDPRRYGPLEGQEGFVPDEGEDAFGNDNAKYTGVGSNKGQEIRQAAMMGGLDTIMENVRVAMSPGGGGMTPELLNNLTQASWSLSSLYNGTQDEGSQAAMDTINFITSVQEDDLGTEDFWESFARMNATMTDPNAPTEQDSALTDQLKEQQELALEQQRVATLMAQRNFERDGITSVVQLLPASARMGFMADLFTVPKFSQLFFGDFDGGASEGPYIGGVLGSTVPQSSGLPPQAGGTATRPSYLGP